MPRRTQATSTPKKLRQEKLDLFLSSSPRRQSSPSRPQTRRSNFKRKTKAKDSDEDVAGQSHVPANTDAGEEGSQSSDAGAIHFEPQVVLVSSSGDEGELPPRPTFSSRRKKRTTRAHSVESASESSAGEEEREVYVRKGKRAGKKPVVVVLDSDEEEELRPMKKRKLVKGERPPTPEEGDLMGEVDEHSMTFRLICLNHALTVTAC